MEKTNIPTSCEVIIVGGGVAGAQAAYHLSQAGVKDVIVLESGIPGQGRKEKLLIKTDLNYINESHIDFKEREFPHALRSGSAVLPEDAGTVKMMIRMYYSTTEEFMLHHGKEGVRKYLEMTRQGLQLQKEIAKKVLPNPDAQIRCLGSLYVATKDEEELMKKEFNLIKDNGCEDVEWWSKKELQKEKGLPEDYNCAIYFPNDAIIDSSTYAASLLEASEDSGSVRVFKGCSPIVSTSTEKEGTAIVTLEDGLKISCKHVILATGGLYTGDKNLSGLIRPCWSYLVSLPHPEDNHKEKTEFSDGIPKFSKNYFTYAFTTDWCWTNGAIRISGEDNFSAFKPPRFEHRAKNLATWCQEQYPLLFKDKELKYSSQYGVYSETPDYVPIVGHTNSLSKVCYLLGCNAWGQTILAYVASLVPGLLGYTELSKEQLDLFSLVTIQRFSLLPEVRNGCI